jgi:hypothetical protein
MQATFSTYAQSTNIPGILVFLGSTKTMFKHVKMKIVD